MRAGIIMGGILVEVLVVSGDCGVCRVVVGDFECGGCVVECVGVVEEVVVGGGAAV
jgi:hypothetical protein